MGAVDFIVFGIILIAIICAAIWIILKKKKGKNSCWGCPYCNDSMNCNCMEKKTGKKEKGGIK